MKKFVIIFILLLLIGIATLILLRLLGTTTDKASLELAENEKPNIILIIPDALRAEQLPCYGYTKTKTKNIDNLVKDSVVFKDCFVKHPGTTNSFSCLFSGLWSPSDGLKKDEKTLAQYLKESGYHTVGFVSSYILWSPEYHEIGGRQNEFNRGFDEYVQDVTLEYPYYRRNEDTTKDIIEWLSESKSRKSPFFLFSHYMDPHGPYEPSYDGEIEKIDKELGKIIKKLKELSLYDNSLIIFTSDHGESLGSPDDHNSPRGHGWFIYSEQIRIPLIIKFPNNKYIKSIDQIVRNMDIMPTLLDYFGIKYNKDEIDGKSLLPAIKENKNLGLISYQYSAHTRVCPEGAEGIIFSEKNILYHYIKGKYSNRYRKFYNISADPHEKNNLYINSNYKKLIDKADEILSSFTKSNKSLKVSPQNKLTRESKKKLEVLKSLGYIKNGAPAPYTKKGFFLMSKELDRIGYLAYSDFIRKPEWGIQLRAKDKYYPIKIATSDNNDYFILANEDKVLLNYNKTQGFKSLGINNITDLGFHSKKNILYFLKNNEIKILVDGKLKNFVHKNINEFYPCEGIYVDMNNNIYILMIEKIIKLDENTEQVTSFNIPGTISKQFVVDKEENLFLAKDKEIIKFNKKGAHIKSFGYKDINYGISSIAIDDRNRIWVLEKESPSVIIYSANSTSDTVVYMS